MDREQERPARALAEIEFGDEVPELGSALPDVGARVGPAVGARVEPGPAQENVLDELEVRVEREHLVVDVAAPSVRRDEEAGNPDAVALAVDARRGHVVVEAAPVIP